MRRRKTIELSPELIITILELRPIDIKNALSLMEESGDFDFRKLLASDWSDMLSKIGGVIKADKGALEDLAFSEWEEVKRAFLEVNTSFFDLIRRLGLNIEVAGPDTSASLTESASS
jgi:hypothetical protein